MSNGPSRAAAWYAAVAGWIRRLITRIGSGENYGRVKRLARDTWLVTVPAVTSVFLTWLLHGR